MIGAATFLLPIIMNNISNTHDASTNASSKNTYTASEIAYMREKMNRPWDGVCRVVSLDRTYTCNAYPCNKEENKYILGNK